MAVSAAPFALKNLAAGLDAEQLRQALASVIPNAGGIVQPGDLNVTQTVTASLGVLVGIGRAWLPGNNVANLSGQSYSTQGQYFALNDAAYTVNLDTANSTNPRIDLIYIGASDTQYGGAADNIVISKVTGTPAATPAAPALPKNAIQLATVNVAANAATVTNANITNSAPPLNLQVATYTGPAVNSGTNAITTFGTLTPTTAATFNNDFCQYNGSSGQIQILKSGVYSVTAIILPANSPNTTSLRIRNTTAGEMIGSAVGGSYVTYETSVAATRYLAANTVLEFSMITANNVLTGSNVTVTKIA